MKHIVLFDTPAQLRALLPLTFTRPASHIRCGILTIARKWEMRLGTKPEVLTCAPLTIKYPFAPEPGADYLFIASDVLPSDSLAASVAALPQGHALIDAAGALVAYRGSHEQYLECSKVEASTVEVVRLRTPEDIFIYNGAQIEADFPLVKAARCSAPINPTVTVIGDPARLFIEPSAKLLCCTINVMDGSVYIGSGAEVQEGANLRGSIALCEHAVARMGAKIYGETTIGPWCKVGGEISNTVFFGYANKAHDGYLGNAVIGEWSNLGAGCVSSNLKNDYSKIRLWNYTDCSFRRTDMQFCGLIMGDHSKAGIQTMFNTATVVGIGCNIHGAGFPRTFIPSFSFGGASGMQRIRFDKFIETARTVMARRHIDLTEADETLLATLYNRYDDYANPLPDND